MDRSRQGQAPFGYRWQGGRLHLSADEANTRRKAFELFLSLRSKSAVARALNEAGLLTRSGGVWSDVQVARILECSSAIGRYPTKRTMSDGQGSRVATEAAARDVVECEPLIAKSVWDRVEGLLKAKRAARQPAPALLDGLVRCVCGGVMNHNSESAAFRCLKCGSAIAVDDLEAVFASDFGKALAADSHLASALVPESEGREVAAEVAQLEDQLAQSTKERAGVEAMLLSKVITKARFEQLHVPIESAIGSAEIRLTALRKKLASMPASPPARPWAEVWAAASPDRRRRLVAAFVSHFTIGPEEVEISYLLPEPQAAPAHSDASPATHAPAMSSTGGPAYIRLPKPGELCPYTGLSRAKLNELILPSARNNHRPPVASKSLRQPGQQRGVRLIILESLMAYLNKA